MTDRLEKNYSLMFIIIVLTMVTTSCSQMGHIVSSDEIKKLYGDSYNDNNYKHEITVSKSGSIYYKDKYFTNRDSNFVKSPGFKSGTSFGPGEIKFGPNS